MESIVTNRLILKKLTPEIYKDLFENYSDTAIKEYFGFTTDEELNAEKENYAKGIATFNRSFINFAITEKETGNVIGFCGFHTWYPKHLRAEIGYSLNDDIHKRKGYMTETLDAVLRYGFGIAKLHRVEALIAEENEASLKLLQKFGFQYEGRLREHYNVNGVMEDSILYSLLKHEFRI
jgi:ribosomal-protein-alanine N-acetyltransferase